MTDDSGQIYALAGQSTGQIVVGGNFTEFDDLPWVGLARLLPSTMGLNTLEFTTARFVTGEASGPAQLTLRRCGDSSQAVSVNLSVVEGNATTGVDYLPPRFEVQFAPLEVTKAVSIEILNDTIMEGDEAIELSLGGAGGAARLGPQASSRLTILEDDLALSNADASFRLSWTFHALQADGKLLVASEGSLWRLDPQWPTDAPIAVDNTFQALATRLADRRGLLHRVLPQSDGKVLVGGYFISPGPGLGPCQRRWFVG